MTYTGWDLLVVMAAAAFIGAVTVWAVMSLARVSRETAEFADELADLDRDRPEDWPAPPRYAARDELDTSPRNDDLPCACGEPWDGTSTMHGRVVCTTRPRDPAGWSARQITPGMAAGLMLAGAAIRQAALDSGMERVPEDDDTAGWRYDQATGALIAPPHTRYFDWPELAEEFRPLPAIEPPRS